jgi:hypothetical protein
MGIQFDHVSLLGPCGLAVLAIALHVANYNITAQVEHRTRVFTKVILLCSSAIQPRAKINRILQFRKNLT